MYEIFAELLKEKGIKPADVTRATGIASATFSDWKNGKYTPSTKKMAQIADFLGVSVDYLMTGDNSIAKNENAGKIPVLGFVRAGELHTEYENVLDYITADYKNTDEYFALMVKGDSMQPRLYEGDIVIVHRQDTAENGEVAVVQVNGDEAVVKKLMKFAHGIGLQSFNPAYPLVQYNEAEIAEKPVRILGKVVEMRVRL